MATKIRDLKVFGGLSVVAIRGYDPGRTEEIDPPGTANWLCERYGMSSDDLTGPGILWQDYDLGDWDFALLVDADEATALTEFAAGSGYDVLRTEAIDDPTHFGDGHAGTVEILKHRSGWVVLPN